MPCTSSCPACFAEEHAGHDVGWRHLDGQLYSATCRDCDVTYSAPEPLSTVSPAPALRDQLARVLFPLAPSVAERRQHYAGLVLRVVADWLDQRADDRCGCHDCAACDSLTIAADQLRWEAGR